MSKNLISFPRALKVPFQSSPVKIAMSWWQATGFTFHVFFLIFIFEHFSEWRLFCYDSFFIFMSQVTDTCVLSFLFWLCGIGLKVRIKGLRKRRRRLVRNAIWLRIIWIRAYACAIFLLPGKFYLPFIIFSAVFFFPLDKPRKYLS